MPRAGTRRSGVPPRLAGRGQVRKTPSPMLLLFCCDPLNPREPDSAFQAEVTAACRLGVRHSLIRFEALVNDDPECAALRVPEQEPSCLGLFRGWMVTPEQYRQLYEALGARGVRLINDPVAYRLCHYLPESYA